MFQKRKCVRRKNTERGLWKMVRCRGNGHNNFLLMNSKTSFSSSENDVLYPNGKFTDDRGYNVLETYNRTPVMIKVEL